MELSGKINGHIPSGGGKFEVRNCNDNHAGDSGFDGEIEIKDRNFNGDRQLNGEKVGDHVMNSSRTSMDDMSEIEIEKREIFVKEDRSNSNEADGTETRDGGHDFSDANEAINLNGDSQLIRPLSHLPQPERPPGMLKSSIEEFNQIQRSQSLSGNFSKYFRDRSNSFSSAILNRFSSTKETENRKPINNDSSVTQINLSGLKVIVQMKKEENKEIKIKGRISFFSRSNCRDCTAVRLFFREKGLKFNEINIDVYPTREKELIERTGSSNVPQIFFNEKLIGGLVALNSLRNSGELERRLKEVMAKRCPDDAPSPPVYGFDDPDEERTDEMISTVRVLRQKLPIQDRLMKMKLVKNCFSGSEMVGVIVQHLDCGRKKAVEIGKELARRHFIHNVFGGNDFEDGNHFYRFLEHEPFIPKCFNFRGSTNDSEPKPAAVVSQKLTKIMTAILESYASEDRSHVNYMGISNSEEFRRYVNLTQDLQRINLLVLSEEEKLAFFMNLHNAMAIHAVIRVGCPGGIVDRKNFFSDFQYIIGGYPYSLTTIKNGILRNNRRAPYNLIKPFGAGDKRLEVAISKVNPLIHFGLCNGTKSSPTVRFFTAQGIEVELRSATRDFFHGNGIEVDLEKRTVHFSRIINWFSADFGSEKDILKWIINYMDSNKAGLLMHLLSDEGSINIMYQNYDWSLNN
ncbi:uncharacterized protein LOC122060927 [Macadamia integrifolia]|uniref:uncharacterized protein LOC122060927 n=1 Tax=Macadamia integrifolia TaxID=60698 RepID=UPI001C4F4E1F|nr:uncharacterized protein LOC122060927 [Macadamia integrifolia]